MDNATCGNTETKGAGQTCYLGQLQFTDTGSDNPSADFITPSTKHDSSKSIKVFVLKKNNTTLNVLYHIIPHELVYVSGELYVLLTELPFDTC